jgi:hypothetical protein
LPKLGVGIAAITLPRRISVGQARAAVINLQAIALFREAGI